MTTPARTYERYTSVAILLHWVIALAIILQLGLGLYYADALDSADKAVQANAFEQIQIHKALGLTVLALTALRIVWRLAHPAPALPAGMSWFERAASHISHIGFYVLMLAMPMTGWAMSSASVEYNALPTLWFGLFEVPHLPIPYADVAQQGAIADTLHQTHELLGYGAIALIVLHVGAALKHHLIDRDVVLARMTPFVTPSNGAAAQSARARVSGGRATLAAMIAAGVGFGGGLLFAENTQAPVAANVESADPMKAEASFWATDYDNSVIRFSGEQSGAAFNGTFDRWSAEIAFDAAALDKSRARVVIDMTSATTGNAMFDGALPDPAWFATGEHPQAVFEAETFRETDGGFAAEGTLTMKGTTQPLTLPFTLIMNGENAEVAGSVDLNRFDWNIGSNTDAGSVAETVELAIEVIASPKSE